MLFSILFTIPSSKLQITPSKSHTLRRVSSIQIAPNNNAAQYQIYIRFFNDFPDSSVSNQKSTSLAHAHMIASTKTHTQIVLSICQISPPSTDSSPNTGGKNISFKLSRNDFSRLILFINSPYTLASQVSKGATKSLAKSAAYTSSQKANKVSITTISEVFIINVFIFFHIIYEIKNNR